MKQRRKLGTMVFKTTDSERAVAKKSELEKIPVPAGRTSSDTGGSSLGNFTVQPPTDYEATWRLEDLDVNHLDNYTTREILDMLLDISPEISKATWDFQRLCNPGYEVKALELESDVENEAGKEHLALLWERFRYLYGSVDILIGRLFMGAYLRGAFCAELVLDGSASETVDLGTPDPYSIRFRQRKDPERGVVWEPGQLQNGDFISLEIPTFRYLPIDPAPASPYGRSLAAPSLFTAIFMISLLHDVKRVVMQQGYKRMDIIINTEVANDGFNYDSQGYTSLGTYVAAAIEKIKSVYSALEPDDAFIHSDMFELNVPAGTVDSDSIGAINLILERLEKQITRGLKSSSLILDTASSTNESDSNRKWEIHAAGVKSLQHHCENMLETLLTLSCQAKGIQCKVEFRFAELRASEMFRDEQTRAMRVQNARNEYAAGYISQDEAAMKTVNHLADMPEPREAVGATATEMLKDDNSGNEALDKNQDDSQEATKPERSIAIAPISDRVNGKVHA